MPQITHLHPIYIDVTGDDGMRRKINVRLIEVVKDGIDLIGYRAPVHVQDTFDEISERMATAIAANVIISMLPGE